MATKITTPFDIGVGASVPNTPLYQYNTGPGSSQQYVAPTGPTGPTLPKSNATLNLGTGIKTSAYDDLLSIFNQYGLGSLVEPLKGLVTDSTSASELTMKLRQTEPYKKRFAANAARTANGLAALSEGEYVALEDQYQNIMRNYGLPASYYAKGDLGRQEGFEKFISNDVSAAELEDRIATAQNRVVNANPQVKQALKQFYPGITDGDILAYTLDPAQGLTDIKRKVTAAEIGGAAIAAGLNANQQTAESLAQYGIDKQQAMSGYQTVAQLAPRGSELSSIYKQDPYTQAVAESEVFGTPGAAGATKQRKKLSELEQASFTGSSGVAGGALNRDRALGAGSF
jgi:hypothetical protein